MKDRIVVLAGNYAQAETWAKEQGLLHYEWLYVSSPLDLRGMRNPVVAKVGTYHERRDVAEFEEGLALCSLGRTAT